MKLFSFRVLALPLVLAFALPASAAPLPKDKPKGDSDPEFMRKMLDSKVSMEFNGIGLPNVLAQLSEDNKIKLVLDEATVRMMGFEPADIMINCKLKDVKLRAGLRTMLNQHNLTCAVVGDSVLVTTEEQVIYKQLKQRVDVDLDNVPLNKALKDLAMRTGVNIIIDPRTNKNKANEAPVTLSVDDVPLDAAVRLMCEIGGLKPARMGPVIFVTTEDRADKLKDSDNLVPNPYNPLNPMFPGLPGGIVPGFGGGIGGGVVPIPPPAVPPAVEEKKAIDNAQPDKPAKN
jgi:hypothetical protein